MNNLSEDKKNYEVPLLTMVAFKTERGYAASDGIKSLSLSNIFSEEGNSGDQSVEGRQWGEDW